MFQSLFDINHAWPIIAMYHNLINVFTLSKAAAVRYLNTCSISSTKLPLMKRTFNAVIVNDSTDSKIRTHVGTISVKNKNLSRFWRAKHDKIFPETIHAFCSSRLNISWFSDGKPAIWKRRRNFRANFTQSPRSVNSRTFAIKSNFTQILQ